MLVYVLGSMPAMWETHKEFLAPGLGLAPSCRHLESEHVVRTLSASPVVLMVMIIMIIKKYTSSQGRCNYGYVLKKSVFVCFRVDLQVSSE